MEVGEHWVYISKDFKTYLKSINMIVEKALTETSTYEDFMGVCKFNLCITDFEVFALIYYYEAKKDRGKWLIPDLGVRVKSLKELESVGSARS